MPSPRPSALVVRRPTGLPWSSSRPPPTAPPSSSSSSSRTAPRTRRHARRPGLGPRPSLRRRRVPPPLGAHPCPPSRRRKPRRRRWRWGHRDRQRRIRAQKGGRASQTAARSGFRLPLKRFAELHPKEACDSVCATRLSAHTRVTNACTVRVQSRRPGVCDGRRPPRGAEHEPVPSQAAREHLCSARSEERACVRPRPRRPPASTTDFDAAARDGRAATTASATGVGGLAWCITSHQGTRGRAGGGDADQLSFPRATARAVRSQASTHR